MRKKILFFVLLLITMSVTEAKQIKEGIDISSIHSNTQNSTENRSETISADITGHTLIITFNDNVGIAHIIIKDSNINQIQSIKYNHLINMEINIVTNIELIKVVEVS